MCVCTVLLCGASRLYFSAQYYHHFSTRNLFMYKMRRLLLTEIPDWDHIHYLPYLPPVQIMKWKTVDRAKITCRQRKITCRQSKNNLWTQQKLPVDKAKIILWTYWRCNIASGALLLGQ